MCGGLEGSSWNAGSCIPALPPVLRGQNVALDPHEGDLEGIWQGKVLKNLKLKFWGLRRAKSRRVMVSLRKRKEDKRDFGSLDPSWARAGCLG